MPTYEYECEACGHRFEKFQSMTATPIKKCPSCGKNKVRRLVGTGAGIIFKGSGFYITDYRSEGYKSAEKADAAPSTATSESKDKPAATESTPAPAAEPKAAEPKSEKPAPKSTPAKKKTK